MRTILALCGMILVGAGGAFWHSSRTFEGAGTFTGAPTVAVADVLERPGSFLKKTIALEDEVRYQCKATGCFFFFVAGGKQLRVDLEQIAVNAPKHEGRQARVEGQLVLYGSSFQLLATAVEFR